MRLINILECRLSANNCLIVPCQGEHKCCGVIRIPFTPTIDGTQEAKADRYWKRESGETLDDITLSPSIDAGECGHFYIRNGGIETC